MANTTNLKWTISKPDWVTVSPSSGEGSQDISVTIQQATSSSDVLTGDITFTCIDCAPTKTIKIPVERCPYEEQCNCDMLVVSQESKVWNWDNTDTITITVSKSNDCISFKKPVLNSGSEYFDIDDSSFDTQSYSTTFTVKPKSNNDSSSPLEGEISVNGGYRGDNCTKTIDLTQYGRQKTCECSDFELEELEDNTIHIMNGDEREVSFNITDEDCIKDISVSSDNESAAICEVADNFIHVSGITEGEANITVSWKANNEDCDTSFIANVYDGNVCNCNMLSLTPPNSLSWEWNEGSSNAKQIKINISNDDCISNISVVNLNNHFKFDYDDDVKTIIVWPISTNATLNDETDDLGISYLMPNNSTPCSKHITLTHKKCECNESILSLSKTGLTWGYDSYGSNDGEQVEIIVNNMNCIKKIQPTIANTDKFDFYYDSSERKITIWPVSENMDTNDREDIVNVEYELVNSTATYNKSISLKQEHFTCPQYNIVPNEQLTCSGGTVTFTVS